MEHYLCKKGLDAKCVYGGAEAIELLRDEEFDLVLCDYVMPKVTGHDVATFLNEMESRPKIGIITGWDELVRAREMEEMNVEFFLKKPFDLKELDKQVNSLLGSTSGD